MCECPWLMGMLESVPGRRVGWPLAAAAHPNPMASRASVCGQEIRRSPTSQGGQEIRVENECVALRGLH